MSKKIKTALRDLVDALEKHAAVTAERPTSSKRAGRATAKVRSAAAAYTSIVADKTGQPNPFVDFLDDETVASLRAERDAVARKHDDKKSKGDEKNAVAPIPSLDELTKSEKKGKSDKKSKSDEKGKSEKFDKSGKKDDSGKSGKKDKSAKSDKSKKNVKSGESSKTAETTDDAKSSDQLSTATKTAPVASSIFVPPLPPVVTVDETVADDTATDPSRDLTSMTLVQLRALAREAGLSGVSRATKAQLIEHLHHGATS